MANGYVEMKQQHYTPRVDNRSFKADLSRVLQESMRYNRWHGWDGRISLLSLVLMFAPTSIAYKYVNDSILAIGISFGGGALGITILCMYTCIMSKWQSKLERGGHLNDNYERCDPCLKEMHFGNVLSQNVCSLLFGRGVIKGEDLDGAVRKAPTAETLVSVSRMELGAV